MKAYHHKHELEEISERDVKTPESPVLKVDDQFKLLRPSKELLYYRRKMMQVSKEFQELIVKVERCKSVCEEHHQLEVEHQKRHNEVIKLQEAVSDLQVHLYQEREQVLRLYAENDRLKIRALQDRKKINYLLSLTSTSEKELNLICSRPWRTVVPQKGTSAFPNNSSAKVPTSCASDKQMNAVDVDALILQNKALSSQLEEQTRLFQDNYHTLLKDRELQREEASTQFEQCQEKISSLTSKRNSAKESKSYVCIRNNAISWKKEAVHCRNSWKFTKHSDKIQKLQQLVTVLKGKYNQLDQRRRLESEGFRTDVRLLRTRLQEIERTLLKFTRCTSLNSLKLDQNVFMSAADTVSKAKRLGEELQLIQRKVAEMDSKLNS